MTLTRKIVADMYRRKIINRRTFVYWWNKTNW